MNWPKDKFSLEANFLYGIHSKSANSCSQIDVFGFNENKNPPLENDYNPMRH